MNTKKIDTEFAIKIIENECKLPFGYGKQIIILLKRGEKYEEMWEELKTEYKDQWDISHIPISMKEYEQKYFPEDKKSIELERLLTKLRNEVKKVLNSV